MGLPPRLIHFEESAMSVRRCVRSGFRAGWWLIASAFVISLLGGAANAQSFGISNLNFNGQGSVSSSTSLVSLLSTRS